MNLLQKILSSVSSIASLIGFVIFVLASVCSASDIYFGQTSAGSNNGSSCANAYAYNDSSHGINITSNWTAGNTLHICGVWSFATGGQATVIKAQNSGSSGSPITIYFESGAALEAYYWSGGAISLNGKSYITINGGSTCGPGLTCNGIIENTLAGTSGQTCPGGSCAYQPSAAYLIYTVGSSNIQVENLQLGPVYVHSGSGNDTAPSLDSTTIFYYLTAGNITINNNVMRDTSHAIFSDFTGSPSNIQIYDNEIYNYNSGIEMVPDTGTLSGIYIHDNHFHDMANWDTTSDSYHHEGIHHYGVNGGTVTNTYVYNNLFDGSMSNCSSSCASAWLWFDPNSSTAWTSSGTAYIWNNVFVVNGRVEPIIELPFGSGHVIYNNTFLGNGYPGLCIGDYLDLAATNLSIENNVFEGCAAFISWPASGSTFTTVDYNLYGNSSGNTPWEIGSHSGTSFSAWKSSCSCDSHAQSTGAALADLSSEGVPSAGFLGAQEGINLTSAATGALSSLKSDTSAGDTRTPVARPVSAVWDVGAYALSSSSSPTPPTNVTVTVQ